MIRILVYIYIEVYVTWHSCICKHFQVLSISIIMITTHDHNHNHIRNDTHHPSLPVQLQFVSNTGLDLHTWHIDASHTILGRNQSTQKTQQSRSPNRSPELLSPQSLTLNPQPSTLNYHLEGDPRPSARARASVWIRMCVPWWLKCVCVCICTEEQEKVEKEEEEKKEWTGKKGGYGQKRAGAHSHTHTHTHTHKHRRKAWAGSHGATQSSV